MQLVYSKSDLKAMRVPIYLHRPRIPKGIPVQRTLREWIGARTGESGGTLDFDVTIGASDEKSPLRGGFGGRTAQAGINPRTP